MAGGDARTGTLFVVSTPIGNLGDLPPRAAEVLRTVAAVAAEDTRRTLKLYAHLAAPPPALLSLPAFDERARVEKVLERLRAGEDVALCTDAGTPGVSDPGPALVAAAWDAGVRVVPLPGSSAALAALAASGFPADRFVVRGLPAAEGWRAIGGARMAGARRLVRRCSTRPGTAPPRRSGDLARALGDRPALVARELTKLHEELLRAPLCAAGRGDGTARRGEGRGDPGGGPPGAGEAAVAHPEPPASRSRRSCGGGSRRARRRPPSRERWRGRGG